MKNLSLYIAITCVIAFLLLFSTARDEFSSGVAVLKKEFTGVAAPAAPPKSTANNRPSNDQIPRPSERQVRESFEELAQRVDTLPEAREEERVMALEKAVNMDVSTEKKKLLLEKFLLETRYQDEQLEELSKLHAFDLMMNQVGPEEARAVLERGQFKARLADAMEISLKNFIPETKLQ